MADEPVFLYVEDDSSSRMVMQTMLIRALGFSHLTMFENSQDFIARLEALTEKPTLIFVDIHMKPHDGFTLLEMIRSHPSYADTRVIALTASVMSDEITRLKEVGFNGAIAKPLSQRTFPELLNSVLNGEEVWHIK